MTDLNTQTISGADENAKTLSARFKWVRGFFYASMLGAFLMLIGTVMVFFTDYTNYDPAIDINNSDMFVGLGALIYMPAILGSIIAFCMFSFRAMKNLQIWEYRRLEISPGWSVGWYFVPFANLWKPYQAMEQIWDGTHDVTSVKMNPTSKLGLWWMFWIATNISSSISTRIATREGPIDLVMQSAAIADTVGMVTAILAVIMIVPILKEITAKQDGKIHATVFA
jgi:hypothetical protein